MPSTPQACLHHKYHQQCTLSTTIHQSGKLERIILISYQACAYSLQRGKQDTDLMSPIQLMSFA